MINIARRRMSLQDRQFCREVRFQQTSGIADEAAKGY